MFDDNASGIHFTTGRRHSRSNSIASLADSMRRVNTATSFFKRILSREDSRPGTGNSLDGPQMSSGKIPTSASTASLAGSKILNTGTTRIADQVIEEVDEQMTITSMRNQHDIRPTAQDLFSQGPFEKGPPSEPVDVPLKPLSSHSNYNRTHSAGVPAPTFKYADSDFLSTSAPMANFRPQTPPGLDEFDREQARSKESAISGQTGKMNSRFVKWVNNLLLFFNFVFSFTSVIRTIIRFIIVFSIMYIF